LFDHGSTVVQPWLNHGSTSVAVAHGHAARGACCDAKVRAHNILCTMHPDQVFCHR
jgi:hypothetical protein